MREVSGTLGPELGLGVGGCRMKEGQVLQRHHCKLSCPKLSIWSMGCYGESIGLLVGNRRLRDKGHVTVKGTLSVQGER